MEGQGGSESSTISIICIFLRRRAVLPCTVGLLIETGIVSINIKYVFLPEIKFARAGQIFLVEILIYVK